MSIPKAPVPPHHATRVAPRGAPIELRAGVEAANRVLDALDGGLLEPMPPEGIMRNPNLSYRARGLYAYLQTLPPAERTVRAAIAGTDVEGRESARKALQELVDAGLHVLSDIKGPRCRTCGGIKYTTSGVTYVVERQRWVKIGRSAQLKSRLRHLRSPYDGTARPDGMDVAMPLRLLFTINYDVEHALHERFAREHVIGEWFTADPAMLADIEAAYPGQVVRA